MHTTSHLLLLVGQCDAAESSRGSVHDRAQNAYRHIWRLSRAYAESTKVLNSGEGVVWILRFSLQVKNTFCCALLVYASDAT